MFTLNVPLRVLMAGRETLKKKLTIHRKYDDQDVESSVYRL